MQADGRIGVYMVGGRDGCSPIPASEVFLDDIFNVFFEADEHAIPQMQSRNDPAKSRIFPYCLADRNGAGTFYLNYDPFTSSLLKRNTEFDFTQWYVNREYPHSDTFRTMREVPVELKTIDSLRLLDDPAVAPPTVIVLDTQGTELAIIRGGRELITEHTAAIVTEAEFAPFYEGQPLFGEVCAGLDEMGFMFIDFTDGPFHIDPFHAPIGLRSKQMAGFSDALFLRKPSAASTPLQLAQLSFAAQLYGQLGYGLHCLDLLIRCDPKLTCIPAERAYRRFLIELDAARQVMPVLFPLSFTDLYPTYERSIERFDATVTLETQAEHCTEQYTKMRDRLFAQQTEVQALLSYRDTPIEGVMNAFGLTGRAQACKDRRITEMTEMLKEVGVEIVREAVPAGERHRG
jgi:FkbM family methyltransferase